MAFTEDDLRKMGLQKDASGNYSKKKVVLSPSEPKPYRIPTGPLQEPMFRTLKLTLFGEPMPKQSFRFGKNGRSFQPKKMTDRLKDYHLQIKKQLPKDFVMFETCVFVRKMHFMYAPLKSFSKEKGKMDAIRNGKKYYKNSRADVDNICKMIFDSLTGIAFQDDSIVVGLDDVKKYYSVGGCVEIILEGY